MGKKLESLELVVHSRNANVYYVEDVNINYSFNTLENIAKKEGAKLEAGDVLVADNPKKTRRKIFKKTVNAALILYIGLLRNNTFDALRGNGNGRVKGEGKPIAQYSNFISPQ